MLSTNRSANRSTSRMLTTLTQQQPMLEWLGDGFGLHLQIGTSQQFVTFRIKNGFDNMRRAGIALTSFLIFDSAEVVDGLRHYAMHPSRWFKLFFRSGNVRYQYEGPNVGPYADIVDKLERGICGADTNIPGYSAFGSYLPMLEGDAIASDNTFGVGNIFRQWHGERDVDFENCLIENLNLQHSQETKFISNTSWLDFIFDYQWQILLLLALAVLFYQVSKVLHTAPDQPHRFRHQHYQAQNTQSLHINVTPIKGAPFSKRLADIGYAAEIPIEFCCPIAGGGEIMDDPVQLNDGQTYDYAQVTRWLETQGRNAKCPSNTSLFVTSITSNITIRKLIDNFVSAKEADYARTQVNHAHQQAEDTRADNFSLRFE